MRANEVKASITILGLVGLGALACSSAGAGPTPSSANANAEEGSRPRPSPSAEPGTAEPAPTPSTPAPVTALDCFQDLHGPVPSPDYDQFSPKVTPSCAGTHHQNITGVERVVFLGDSVTAGTPPTPIAEFYRKRLEVTLKQKFGANVQFSSCAGWGSRIDDLLENDNQIGLCFPGGVENKRTLVVMTNGGNDISSWAKDKLGTTAAMAEADVSLAQLRTAIDWLKSPEHFPNGSYVVFGNVYEYTDTSGDLSSCITASLSGFSGSWPEGKPAIVHLEEGFMKIAVETKTDIAFLLEHFCGHGYKRNDPTLQCWRGPNAPLWFDATCYHPNPDGHAEIASRFANVIDGI
jgi:lysophospholipase L1-like esterase